jgi:hypothetical protein
VDSADDGRLEQFADFFTRNGEYYPEVGASCENAVFLASPLEAGDASAPDGEGMPTDAPSTGTESGSATPEATTETTDTSASTSSEAPAS